MSPSLTGAAAGVVSLATMTVLQSSDHQTSLSLSSRNLKLGLCFTCTEQTNGLSFEHDESYHSPLDLILKQLAFRFPSGSPDFQLVQSAGVPSVQTQLPSVSLSVAPNQKSSPNLSWMKEFSSSISILTRSPPLTAQNCRASSQFFLLCSLQGQLLISRHQ